MSERRTEDFGGYSVADEGNGISVITVPEGPKPAERPRPSGLLARLAGWWKGLKARPVVKVVDTCDPAGEVARRDPDYESSPKKAAVVIGVEVDF